MKKHEVNSNYVFHKAYYKVFLICRACGAESSHMTTSAHIPENISSADEEKAVSLAMGEGWLLPILGGEQERKRSPICKACRELIVGADAASPKPEQRFELPIPPDMT